MAPRAKKATTKDKPVKAKILRIKTTPPKAAAAKSTTSRTPAPKTRGPKPKKEQAPNIRILYVDDEPINIANFKAAFARQYEILSAESGKQALELFKKETNIALVVSDQRMPGMTGIELLEEIYRLNPIPVRMILTAYKDIDEILGAINKGHIFRYILKPWEDKDLRPILKQAAEMYMLAGENHRLLEELKAKNTQLETVNEEKQEINKKLMEDIIRRQDAEEELALRSRELEEVNTAMKVLLKQSGEAKQELESKILSNIKDLIMPYVDDLEERLEGRQDLLYVKVIRANLEQITSSFSNRLAMKLNLTPRELQIAELVRQGRTSKDVAKLLNLSRRTVETYRDNLRRKLNVKNKKQNLRSLLLSIH